MKKIISFLVLLSLLLPLSACAVNQSGDPGTESEVETAETQTINEAEEKLADLAAKDFNGRSFRIASDDLSLILPVNGQNYVGKKLYDRNDAIEKKFHIKITATEESGLPTVGERIRTEALAGTDYCDLAIVSSSICQQLVSANALINAASVPYVLQDGAGLFSASTDAMTLGNNIYGICGDFCYSVDGIFVVYFNKTIAEATGLPDLYQLVRDNQWDLENFQLYAEEAYSLGRIGGQKIYGFCSPERAEVLFQAFWAASDLKYVENAYGQKPSLAYDDSDIREPFITRARKVLYRTVSYFTNTNASMEAFRDGQILFMIAPLSQIEELSGSKADWGVLPMPVYDINQETHRSYQKNLYQVACFPKGIGDIDFSGQITRALMVSSQGLSSDLGLTKYLNLYLRSSEDAEMLTSAISEPYFDPTEFFGTVFPEYLAATQTLIQRVVSSEGNYGQLYKQYTKLFETFLNEKVS